MPFCDYTARHCATRAVPSGDALRGHLGGGHWRPRRLAESPTVPPKDRDTASGLAPFRPSPRTVENSGPGRTFSPLLAAKRWAARSGARRKGNSPAVGSMIPAGAGMCVSGLDPCRRNATLQPAMAGTQAFLRAKIDAPLTDVGWNLTDGRSVHFEYTLGDGKMRPTAPDGPNRRTI